MVNPLTNQPRLKPMVNKPCLVPLRDSAEIEQVIRAKVQSEVLEQLTKQSEKILQHSMLAY